jgi:hypothetical protein
MHSLKINERLLWLRYSGFQASCHNTNISEEPAASIFWLYSDDGGSKFLRSAGNHPPTYTASHPHKSVTSTLTALRTSNLTCHLTLYSMS